MTIGACEHTKLKVRSEKMGIPFSDLLWEYVLEDMMLRICTSDYREMLWLESSSALGCQNNSSRSQNRIRFFYQESERKIPKEKLKPGQKLSVPMAQQMIYDIFHVENEQEIFWDGRVVEEQGWFLLCLEGTYHQMKVPLTVALHSSHDAKLIPGRQERDLIAIEGKKISYYIYAPENQLSRDIFLIMERLELISDMSSYWRAYDILNTLSLSGRFVLEELEVLTENVPNMRTKKRFEQISEYRTYTYMRKRWEKYLRNHGEKPVAWEEALDRILAFIGPVWNCLCDNEIFFDDWMPELGRFLG